MGDIFLKLLNMSITANWLILAVLCVRLLFRKMPKWVNCILWGIVAIRLMVPFSVESEFSLQPSAEPIKSSTIVEGEILSYMPSIDSNLSMVDDVVNPILMENFAYDKSESVAPLQLLTEVASGVWLCGMIALFILSIGSMVRLRLLVREAVLYKDNLFICDQVRSPFILGIINPRIFLSSALSNEEIEYVMAHEKAHIKRKDHLWKPFAYLLLCIYWFNPLCWVAYILLCKDIELACDEKVIRDMSFIDKKEYSRVLLSCATQRNWIMVCPVAFGEVGVKERVKKVLNYKKPALLISIVAIIICIIVAICFLTNPISDDSGETAQAGEIKEVEEVKETDGIQDLAYYLELSVFDMEFQNMSDESRNEILTEYGELLEGYTMMARESVDGKTAYIVGHYEGDVTKSPLYKMYKMEYSSDKVYQVLYLEENNDVINKIIDEQGVKAITDEGYVIENSWIYLSIDSEYILIQPIDSAHEVYSAFSKYMDPARGRSYIEEAISRGIAINTITEPHLRVYMMSEKYGEIVENIPLTEAEATAMLTESTQELGKGYGIAVFLYMDGENYTFDEGLPKSVLDLVVKKCGYKFASPDHITAPIKEAKLDCSWLEKTIYLDATYLPRLEEILKGAKCIGVGNCGYGARLTITLENDEVLTIFKGTDDCGSLVFGSYGGYVISDEADDEFWEMFGLSPSAEERLFPNCQRGQRS